jgi:hypothetical protein
MGWIEDKQEVEEAKREGWLDDRGRLTEKGLERIAFESSLDLPPGQDPRQVGRDT